MQTYDPRSISSVVYTNLQELKDSTNTEDHKEQKGQAVEIYSYLATWGLLRLKAEEFALASKKPKQKMVECFFKSLQAIAFPEPKSPHREQAQSTANKGLKDPPLRPSQPSSTQTETSNNKSQLLGEEGLKYLASKEMSASNYLGLTGLALQISREFAFWAEAIYPKEK